MKQDNHYSEIPALYFRQGKCAACSVVWTWDRRQGGGLKGAACQQCHAPLERTSCLSKLPFRRGLPLRLK